MDFNQTMNNVSYAGSEFCFSVLKGQMTIEDKCKEHGGKHAIAFQTNLVYGNLCRA